MLKITVSRSMTINTGNFNNIKPQIEITRDGIKEEEDLKDEYERLSSIVDVLMAFEIVRLSDEAETIDEMGYKKYSKSIEKNTSNMNSLLDTLVKGMSGDNNV